MTQNTEATGIRLVVCGGRDYRDRQTAYSELDALRQKREIAVLIHGDAQGADTLAADWARARGIAVEAYPPRRDLDGNGRDWKFRRNERMLMTSVPDVVAALPGGPGTAHTVRRAREAGIEVMMLGANTAARR